MDWGQIPKGFDKHLPKLNCLLEPSVNKYDLCFSTSQYIAYSLKIEG